MREPALRSGDIDGAAMSKLVGRGVKVVMKADGLSQSPDVFLIPSQKVPAISGRCALRLRKIVDVSVFLGARELRSLQWIEADGDNFKLFAWFEVEHLKTCHHAVQNLVAEHRTLVIDERKHNRFLAEVVAKANRLPSLVAER